MFNDLFVFQDDQTLSPHQHNELPRRHSLVPPPTSNTPQINVPNGDSPDKKRRPSAQSLGPFSFSVSFFGDSRRSSIFSSETRRSSERLRRPSTHSVGILPIASFGEGTEKPRKPSTHSLGILPLGWGEEGCSYDGSPRRPSATSLGPYWIHVRLGCLLSSTYTHKTLLFTTSLKRKQSCTVFWCMYTHFPFN